MGGFQINNVAPGILGTDAVNVNQLSNTSNANPTGTLIAFAGSSPPTGYLLCFGQAVSRTTYATLFSVIGTIYGTGDGSTTFNVPNLNGYALAGLDNMGGTAAGILTGLDSLGSILGTQNVTLSINQIPSHNHTDAGHTHIVTDPGHDHLVAFSENSASGSVSLGVEAYPGANQTNTSITTTGISNQTGFASINNTGGGLSHTNIQPTFGVLYCIKT